MVLGFFSSVQFPRNGLMIVIPNLPIPIDYCHHIFFMANIRDGKTSKLKNNAKNNAIEMSIPRA